jgi:UDP-glucuronate decarboxylase
MGYFVKILITGGAGFLGSNLCKRLLNEGHTIYCIDNLSTGFKLNLPNHNNFNFIYHDINNKLPTLLVDQIYNLASPASPPRYQKNPLFTLKTNTNGLINVLDLALECRARVLHTSTSEIYGDPEINYQSENYNGNVNPLSIRSCYDESKRLSETIMREYNRMYGLDTKIVRLFNVYGPGLDPEDGRVVSNFINQALNNKPLTIYGTANQTRSFQYVDDAIDGLIKLMNSNYNLPVNIGNPSEFTILELANIILEMIKTESEIEYRDLPTDDPKQRKPDISRAKEILNWEPKINLRDGLIKTIDFFRERYAK